MEVGIQRRIEGHNDFDFEVVEVSAVEAAADDTNPVLLISSDIFDMELDKR